MRATRTPQIVSRRALRDRGRFHLAGFLGAVVVATVSLLAACGGYGLSSSGPAERSINAKLDSPPSDLTIRGSTASEDGSPQANEPDLARKLIQNAELHLEVESCDEARTAIEAAVTAAGGYVSSANVNHYEGRASRAVLVLRLPATSLGSSLVAFAGLGTVVHESLNTQDITEQYFDLQARLDSARKLEARLHELLETEAEELKDLLEVERELARVRETIERFEGKVRLWDQQVALSTLTVQLTTRELFAAAEPKTLGEQIGQTISHSWQALVNAGRAVVLVVVAMLPWILPILLLGWLALRLVRRLERGMARRAAERRAAYVAKAGGSSDD